MTGQLILHILQVSGITGESSIATDSSDEKQKVYHWNTWQVNPHKAIVYHEISTSVNRCKSGISHTDDVQVQITVWNPDSAEAAVIAGKIRSALEGWEGTYNSTYYHQILLENEVETWDYELEYYGKIQTWIISYARG